MKPEKSEEISETEIKLKQLPLPPDDSSMLGFNSSSQKWDWEEQKTPRDDEGKDRERTEEKSVEDSDGTIPTDAGKEMLNKSGLRDFQANLGNELLDAYNEEEFIQKELSDIRQMKKQKMLDERIPMSEEQKVHQANKGLS